MKRYKKVKLCLILKLNSFPNFGAWSWLVEGVHVTFQLRTTFFICYLAAPRPFLGYCQRDTLTNPVLY